VTGENAAKTVENPRIFPSSVDVGRVFSLKTPYFLIVTKELQETRCQKGKNVDLLDG
jgi:hypothetical protein